MKIAEYESGMPTVVEPTASQPTRSKPPEKTFLSFFSFCLFLVYISNFFFVYLIIVYFINNCFRKEKAVPKRTDTAKSKRSVTTHSAELPLDDRINPFAQYNILFINNN